MLVIRCREGETIQISDSVTIRVLGVGSGRVKLGVTAPREMLVERTEMELTKRSNSEAARADMTALVDAFVRTERATGAMGSAPRLIRMSSRRLPSHFPGI